MDEQTKRIWDVVLGFATPLLTLLAILIGVWQFNEGEADRQAEQERQAIIKDRADCREKMWAERLNSYRSLAELAGRLAAMPPGKSQDEARAQFEAVYWGTTILFEDKEVEDVMIRFRLALNNQKAGLGDSKAVKVWAGLLVQACRASLEKGLTGEEGASNRRYCISP